MAHPSATDDADKKAILDALKANAVELATGLTTAAAAVDQATLLAFGDRHGVYFATEERSGPFSFEKLDEMATQICQKAPPDASGRAPQAKVSFMPKRKGR